MSFQCLAQIGEVALRVVHTYALSVQFQLQVLYPAMKLSQQRACRSGLRLGFKLVEALTCDKGRQAPVATIDIDPQLAIGGR